MKKLNNHKKQKLISLKNRLSEGHPHYSALLCFKPDGRAQSVGKV